MQYPKPNEEELPELYRELDEELKTIDDKLHQYFSIENGKVLFNKASEEDFLDAMVDSPAEMVPFFQKVTGLTDREFERLYNEKIGSLKSRTTDFHDDGSAQTFASVVASLLDFEVDLEGIKYTFVKMWENDQRRHHRARYEEKVREYLENEGIPNFKGNTLPGEPDFVVPEENPYSVVGEVRVIQPRDYKKRFKEFGSEARAARENFDDVRFVAVAKLPPWDLKENRKERRQDIHDSSAAEIDGVFFHDELDELAEKIHEWSF